jgi:hypothetical protein
VYASTPAATYCYDTVAQYIEYRTIELVDAKYQTVRTTRGFVHLKDTQFITHDGVQLWLVLLGLASERLHCPHEGATKALVGSGVIDRDCASRAGRQMGDRSLHAADEW